MKILSYANRLARCLLGAAVLATFAAVSMQAQADPIKIGLLEDQTGEIAIFTLPKVHGTILAVEEINAAGGILGRQIELIAYDPQFDNAKFQKFARRLLQKDKVDVLFAGATSASREAVRPIANRFDALYFYTNQYEGGVCDANVIATGAVPEQQFSTLIPYMMKRFGGRVYTIAADYNFGQISAEWTRVLVKKGGGEIVGEEMIPMGVSQFGQTIKNMQKAKPDWIMALTVGASQDSFFEQAHAAKLGIPMGSSIRIALGFEHKRFAPPALQDMYVTANWFEEIDREDANAFKARWRKRWPKETYISQMGHNAYAGIYLYKKVAEMAGTTDKDAILKVVNKGGVCIDAPEGRMCIDPKSQHLSHTITLLSVNPDHSINVIKKWDKIDPYWLSSVGCDLTVKDHNDQYTPSYLPKK